MRQLAKKKGLTPATLPDRHGSLRQRALLGEKAREFGNTVPLAPPQFVKPYVKTNKNVESPLLLLGQHQKAPIIDRVGHFYSDTLVNITLALSGKISCRRSGQRWKAAVTYTDRYRKVYRLMNTSYERSVAS